MEKNAVRGNPSFQSNNKYASKGCPICGSSLDYSGTLPRCPKHGTAPFEYGAHISRKGRR